MEKYKNLRRVSQGELMILESQLEGKNEFTKEQAEKFECITHGYKSLLCIIDKEKELEEMEQMPGMSMEGNMNMSERRGRNMNNGQFVSRENRESYMSGYEDGVRAANEGMNNGSGHRVMNHYGPYMPRMW